MAEGVKAGKAGKAGNSEATRGAKTFRAVLEADGQALGWTVARLPFAPAEAWPRQLWPDKVRLRVRGEAGGFAFRTSLFPDVRGGYFLPVTRAMKAAAGVDRGSLVEFSVEPDPEPRPAEVPEELAVLLEDEAELRAWFEGLSESMRREIGKWCAGVTGEAAKLRRAQQMAERLLSTMEAERELPPALAQAFGERPKARAGWALLTEAQRRGELMGVFSYQTPEARGRRIEKLCDLAESRRGSGAKA